MHERLFDSMVSIRAEPKGDEPKGDEPHLGLGLYIVRLIAEFHRGRVRADDRGEGPGVVVTVSLPLAA
jgi:signal transduction histidine kinase